MANQFPLQGARGLTDADGNIAQHVEYIPYGEVFVEERNSQFSTNFLFDAKELDNETGLYYYGARYLDPTGAMWLSVDPMWEKYAGMSPYNYCAGNSVKLVDPDGREPRKVTITISGNPTGNKYYARTYPETMMAGENIVLFKVPTYTVTVSGTDNNGNQVSKSWETLRFMPYLNQHPEKTGYKTKTGETPKASGLADQKSDYRIQSYNPNYKIHNTYSPENGGFVIEGNFMIHDGPDGYENYGWGAAGCFEIMGKNGFNEFKTFIFSLSGMEGEREQGLVDFVKTGNLRLNLEKAERPKFETKYIVED